MIKKPKNKIVGCLFAVLMAILMLSSSVPARLDLYGADGDIIYSGLAEESIVFYDTAGNDSVLCFESDVHGTLVMCLNGTEGSVVFYGNVSMLKNLTVADDITASYFYGNGSGLTWLNVSNITGLNTSYLKLDGSNADQDINIGTYDFTTIGDIMAGNLNVVNWDTAYTERGSAIAGDLLTWDGSELDCSVGYNDLTGNPSDRITAGTNLSWVGDTLNVDWTDFLTSEADPIFSAHVASTIQSGWMDNWNTSYVERGSQIAGSNLTWDGSELDVDWTDFAPSGWNPFDQNLNTTNNVTFWNITATKFFIGNGSLLTGIASFIYSNWFNQNLNATDDVIFGKVTSTFHGDGGNLTNITGIGGNPFNQWLNTTDNATFTWMDILNDINITGNIAPTVNISSNLGSNLLHWLHVYADTYYANGGDSSQWNTAFGWGDHGIVGYLTSESDPVYSDDPAFNITDANISNWDTAYGWGDHALAGYLTSTGNPFNQDLNTTDNVTFTYLDVAYDANISGDLTVTGTSYFSNSVDIDANLTMGDWSLGKPAQIFFDDRLSSHRNNTYIGLSSAMPRVWTFNSDYDLRWNIKSLAFDGGDLVFVGNETTFTTKYNNKLQFDVEGGEIRLFGKEYIFNAIPGEELCGAGNVSFYNSVDGGKLLMYLPGAFSYINMSVNVSMFENLTVNNSVTASSFHGDGGNLTNVTGDGYAGGKGHPHDQDLNTTSDVTFNSVSGDGSGLTGVPGDGYAGGKAHPHDQDLNTTNAVAFATVDTGQGANELYDMDQNVLIASDVTFNSITGDGSSLTNLPNIFNQWLNTTDNATFDWLDILNDVNITGDLTVTGTSYLGNVVIDADNISVNNITESTTAYGVHLLNNTAIGSGVAGIDYTLTFDGEDSDIVLTWKEDEEYLHFSENITFPDSVDILLEEQTMIGGHSIGGRIKFVEDDFATVAGSVYYDSTAATKYLVIDSANNILLDANSGAGDITLNGVVLFEDDVHVGYGTGNTAVGGDPDFFMGYASATSSLDFDANTGFGINAVLFDFNSDSVDCDFRVQGDNDADLLYVDAGTDRVGIGTNAPDQELDVVGSVNISGNLNASGYVKASAFHGDGGNLTNITCIGGNPFNQWLNTTDNATFDWLDIVNDANISGDLTVEGDVTSSGLFVDKGSWGASLSTPLLSLKGIDTSNALATVMYFDIKNQGTGTDYIAYGTATLDNVAGGGVAGYYIDLKPKSDGSSGTHSKTGFYAKNDVSASLTGGSYIDKGLYVDMDGVTALPGTDTGIAYTHVGADIKRAAFNVYDLMGGSWDTVSTYGLRISGWGSTDVTSGVNTFNSFALYSDGGDSVFDNGHMVINGSTVSDTYALDVEGSIECLSLHETSDERVKTLVMELPTNRVKRLCENLSIYIFRWHNYSYIYNITYHCYEVPFYNESSGEWENITECDEIKTIIGIDFGNVTDDYDVGIPAQHLYSYLLNFTDNPHINQLLADGLVLRPDNENVQLWNVNYRAVSMIFARYSQILGEEIQDNTDMLDKLVRWASSDTLPAQYRFDPDDW